MTSIVSSGALNSTPTNQILNAVGCMVRQGYYLLPAIGREWNAFQIVDRLTAQWQWKMMALQVRILLLTVCLYYVVGVHGGYTGKQAQSVGPVSVCQSLTLYRLSPPTFAWATRPMYVSAFCLTAAGAPVGCKFSLSRVENARGRGAAIRLVIGALIVSLSDPSSPVNPVNSCIFVAACTFLYFICGPVFLCIFTYYCSRLRLFVYCWSTTCIFH